MQIRSTAARAASSVSVGMIQSARALFFRVGHLAGQDHLKCLFGHSGARQNALSLPLGIGRDHGDPVHLILIAAFEQQGNIEDHQIAVPVPLDKVHAVGGDQRMHDPFKPSQRAGIGCQRGLQRGAVDRALAQRVGKGGRDRRHRRPACGIQPMHRLIRVPDRVAQIAKHLRGRGFSHADAAGQSQKIGHARTA